jgi:hypothetical protein
VSYSEKDGSVILTMSREDYNLLLMMLGAATTATVADGIFKSFPIFVFPISQSLGLMNRLNSGNPNYTPYQVEKK